MSNTAPLVDRDQLARNRRRAVQMAGDFFLHDEARFEIQDRLSMWEIEGILRREQQQTRPEQFQMTNTMKRRSTFVFRPKTKRLSKSNMSSSKWSLLSISWKKSANTGLASEEPIDS